MLKHKTLIILFVLSCMLACCVYGDTNQVEVMFVVSVCDAVQLYLTFHICKLNYFDILCNISFKEHLPEDGHTRWPKHVGNYTVYNTINLHTCTRTCWSGLYVSQWIINAWSWIIQKNIGKVYIQRNKLHNHAMAQVVSYQPLPVEALVQSQANPCGINGRQVALG